MQDLKFFSNCRHKMRSSPKISEKLLNLVTYQVGYLTIGMVGDLVSTTIFIHNNICIQFDNLKLCLVKTDAISTSLRGGWVLIGVSNIIKSEFCSCLECERCSHVWTLLRHFLDSNETPISTQRRSESNKISRIKGNLRRTLKMVILLFVLKNLLNGSFLRQLAKYCNKIQLK